MSGQSLGLLVPRAAVLGQPVRHSLSPALHNAAYGYLGLTDWHYTAIECGADGLAAMLAQADEDWAGFSCTMPLKRVALERAEYADPLAVAVGAANTLLPRDGGWWAAITDVAGIMGALAEHAVTPNQVTLLGAGATAQAALAAMRQLGICECTVLVRDAAHTAELQAAAERLDVVLAISELDIAATALAADLVISTLPARAADLLAPFPWRTSQAVLDVVYDPWPTALAAAAAGAGSTVISGALMLLHQAAELVWLMTGRPAPVEAMRAALRASAPRCGV
jgi:shikimate dehydrogenase